jgi:2-desacetyl-2-hydroxyethyl bacteriochlorophyllide A dehydrogenase
MRAIVIRLGAGGRREKALVNNWPDADKPTGNQVRTETLYSGITNGTERNDLLGGNYAHAEDSLPSTGGYQNVGRVVETGPEVTHLNVGDLLYMSVNHVEYAVVPEDGLLIKLPQKVDPKAAALFGMAAVAMRTCRNAELKTEERIIIAGAGCVGQLAAQIATVMGARVTLCDINQDRLQVAREIGAAAETIDVSGDAWDQAIAEESFDAALDLAGVPGMENKLVTAVRHRGRVLLIAGRFDITYDFNLGQAREITIKQNSHFDNSDLAALCGLVACGEVSIAPLLRNVLPVSEAKRIYDTLRDKPEMLLGTVFDWGE